MRASLWIVIIRMLLISNCLVLL